MHWVTLVSFLSGFFLEGRMDEDLLQLCNKERSTCFNTMQHRFCSWEILTNLLITAFWSACWRMHFFVYGLIQCSFAISTWSVFTSCHKNGNTELYGKSMYVTALKFPFTGSNLFLHDIASVQIFRSITAWFAKVRVENSKELHKDLLSTPRNPCGMNLNPDCTPYLTLPDIGAWPQ